MKIKDMNLEQAKARLATVQETMGNVLEEAETDGNSYDFSQVKCLGDDVKGQSAITAKFRELNDEATDLAKHIEDLSETDQAVKDFKGRERGVTRLPFGSPAGGAHGGDPAVMQQIKALGRQVIESKAFKDWADNGSSDGVRIEAESSYPSDVMAKGASTETVGTKAVMSTGAGFAPESLRIGRLVEAVTRPIQLLDIIPMGRTSMAAIKYMEETTRTHAAAEVAEGAAYPESAFVFTERTATVQKVADSVPVTDEQLEDVPLIESYLNGRLSFGLRQRVDAQSVAGDGTAGTLTGILNTAGIQTHAKGADTVIDATFKAMTKVRTVGRAIPTHVIYNPADWERIRLSKDADGNYLYGPPSQTGEARIFGLPVVQNEVVPEGTAIVGAFEAAYISIYERKGIDVQVGFRGDQFVEGKRTIRADMRLALIIFRPAAFCEVTGLNL